jgi:hypothetical protein
MGAMVAHNGGKRGQATRPVGKFGLFKISKPSKLADGIHIQRTHSKQLQ